MGRPTTYIMKECPVCGVEFKTYPIRERNTCSKKCMGIYQTGENNPNYGVSWSKEQREAASKRQLENSEELSKRTKESWVGADERRSAASKLQSQLGKKRIGVKNPFYGKSHTEDTKKVISIKSKEKFTKEFKETQRGIMEAKGHWRPLDEVEPYHLYRNKADWIARMWDIVPSEYDIKQVGIFNVATNPKGLVRDHKLGRRLGFELGIFPELLRHPMNCQIIPHKQNVEKAVEDDSIITHFELFTSIYNYKEPWDEQDLCLSLIEKYFNGERYVNTIHI